MQAWKSLKGICVKHKWNVNPEDKVTLLRLISELEGALYILECLDGTEEEVGFILEMKKKYWKQYFRHGV